MNIEALPYGSQPSEEPGAWVHVSAPKNPENAVADPKKDLMPHEDMSADFCAWNSVGNAVRPRIKRENDSLTRSKSLEQDLIWPGVSSNVERISSTVNVIPSCKEKYPSVPHFSTPCGVDIGVVRATLEAEPPQWMPDSTANCCLQCRTLFKPVICGRHHCRLCGGIFCRNCSTGRCLLPVKFQERNPQRVCDICYQRLEPIQRILADRVSNASQIATHDVTDMTCMRGWLNSPLGFTMEQEIYKATNTIRSYYQIGGISADKLIPNAVLKGARGLAILTAVKVGMVVTYKVGTGLVLARRVDGTWSAPSAIACCGMGWGAQAGGELTDFIIVLRNSKAIKAFSGRLNISIGAGLSATAGPVGRVAEADLCAGDGGTAACYTYSYSKGAFLGASLEGNVMTTRSDTNHRFYGDPYISSWDVLLGPVPRPRAASSLYNALHTLFGKLEEMESTLF
ncbi:uncharacterized protein LOC131071464 [Cryptomeria japonica]|uniref:uncharacterized protein LOC131071464 n=1 Tax=Cryptomeria japonica TaxID=3369 RepID=UPI0027DA004C|nr:uncharacterized protein LOC131071464 [Cryptomeria japonica]XP_057863308.2 uncharacterized protein LOC131071464 [Cryptomeria japonica]XP_057863318.2 uncharacterized protein LOC131071464 [Cryptomeria japonica]XP_057863328.2 uncharacterized protein LOC131071464 [Cryptomeria japonica]XP_057863336.2 uncharacterized protein LOC131071464 [Cryptomeria japonica]XP_057863345.2 uncharacterized protein LOC131071464 [Cryptomeria japonica]XP_057863351.2 uncharacterized protein LOC131071464 [Cryptomeria 